MKEHFTVIPADGLIIVDGISLSCEFTPHLDNLHAVQWRQGAGEIEINNRGFMSNRPIASYETDVQPYVEIWQSAFDRINEAAQQAEPLETPNWWRSLWRKRS